jgi:hypothetical protein
MINLPEFEGKPAVIVVNVLPSSVDLKNLFPETAYTIEGSPGFNRIEPCEKLPVRTLVHELPPSTVLKMPVLVAHHKI